MAPGEDMKGILARNLTQREWMLAKWSVNPAEGERYLSPLASWGESAISQRRADSSLAASTQRKCSPSFSAKLKRSSIGKRCLKLLSALTALSPDLCASDAAQEWSRGCAPSMTLTTSSHGPVRCSTACVWAVSSRTGRGAPEPPLVCCCRPITETTLRAILSEDPAEQEVARHA
jgi:hypothetical protein